MKFPLKIYQPLEYLKISHPTEMYVLTVEKLERYSQMKLIFKSFCATGRERKREISHGGKS